MEELNKLTAKGEKYNDGVERVGRFAIIGMKYMPDLANQIKLVSACIQEPPSNEHLERRDGDPYYSYTVSDIFLIQNTIKKLFHSDDK